MTKPDTDNKPAKRSKSWIINSMSCGIPVVIVSWRNTIFPYLKDPYAYKCPTHANSRIGLDGFANDYSVAYTKNGFFVPIGSPRLANVNIDNGESLIILCESNDYG